MLILEPSAAISALQPFAPGQGRIKPAVIRIVLCRAHDRFDVSAEVPFGVGEPLIARPDLHLLLAARRVVDAPLEVPAE